MSDDKTVKLPMESARIILEALNESQQALAVHRQRGVFVDENGDAVEGMITGAELKTKAANHLLLKYMEQ